MAKGKKQLGSKRDRKPKACPIGPVHVKAYRRRRPGMALK